MAKYDNHENIKNKIIYFYFNSTRKHCKIELEKLSEILDDILSIIKISLYECDDIKNIDIYVSYFISLYKLIAYTRDINAGKGERDLTYMMIDIWYKYFPDLARNILETINEKYGSRKNLKYFCKYTKNENGIDDSIKIWNNQLEKDLLSYGECKRISLVSKWIPREKSAFGWLFEKSAVEWYSRIYINLPSNINTIKKKYRILLSFLNTKIDTPQIKETQGKWSEIIPENISLTTKSKQYNTFLNVNNSLDIERINCKNNFEKYYDKYPKMNHFYSKSFHLGEYSKKLHIQNQKYWDEIKKDILYSVKKEKKDKQFLLPIVNISITNEEEYLDAISIGCMISELSVIHNRMIVYDKNAYWMNMSNCSIIQKIKKIKEKTIRKGNSNILNVLELMRETKQDLMKVTLVIISDFSTEPINLNKIIMEKIDKSPEKIIYWNVGSKIPLYLPLNLNDSKNNILISGSSSSIIKYLYQHLETITDTYSFINNIVNQSRYIKIEEYFKKK